MTEPAEEPASAAARRLAAVMFLDMTGYSALMRQSENRAQQAVATLWSIARPLIASHGGTEERVFGDGMLITFSGTIDAARCGLAILDELAQLNRSRPPENAIHAHAGLHLGDISRTEHEIFGDGVNLAARLVSFSPSGGIAVSPHVRDQLHNVLERPIKSLGVKALKNIKTPLEIFCLPGPECTPEALDAAAAAGTSPTRRWRFGAAEFDERTLELSVGGIAVDLDRKAVDALRCLLRHAGETVTKEELREAAGGISEAALTRRISKLREALRDGEHNQIKTQAGTGYRLAAAVSVEAAPSASLTQFDFKPGDHPPLRPLWSLDAMLGQGGQGEVWLARHTKTGEERVYKFALDPGRLSSLKREITLSRLLHSASHNEHFIRVVDWNLDLAPYFIECEYGGSQDLPAWAEAQGGIGKVPLATRLELLAQVADALAAAHSIGVLHKDLKPRNVLIHQAPGEPPSIKLADFGSGGVLDAQHLEDAGITDMGFTHSVVIESGSTRATPLYVAPELLAGQPATVQADIYALGVMLYQLIVGNLRKPLSPGWETDIRDELLREDIAATAHGNPQRRLPSAASLAHRLRNLEQRRAEREAERAAEERARLAELAAEEARQKLERLTHRRRWAIVVMATLALGLVLAVYQQQKAIAAEYRARLAAEQAQAAEAKATQSAQEAQAVADFLSKDLFTVVGEKPLSTLTVPEMLAAAAEKLDGRQDQLPAVAAQLRLAVGNALLATERVALAENQFEAALSGFEAAGELGSRPALQIAARLLTTQMLDPRTLPGRIPRYQRIFEQGRQQLGPADPDVLQLAPTLAQAHFIAGDWPRGVADMQGAVDALDDNGISGVTTEIARIRLGEMLIYMGRYARSADLEKQALANNASTGNPIVELTAYGFLSKALTELDDFPAARQALDRVGSLANTWTLPGANVMQASRAGFEALLLLRSGYSNAAIPKLASAIPVIAAALDASGSRDPSGEFRTWLATAQAQAGEFDQAILTAREALDVQANFYGKGHPMTQAARITLAEVLLQSKATTAAIDEVSAVNRNALSRLADSNPLNIRLHQLDKRLAQTMGD